MSERDSAQAERAFQGLRNLAERITPWLVDVGSWMFGGLTAVNLFVIAALITVGPVDTAIRIATAAFAAAFPLNVAGIMLLRLIKDANDVGFDDLTLQAFQEAGFPEIDTYFPSPAERASQRVRGSRVAVLYALGIAALSIAFTLTGMAAAVWHVSRWIAAVFLFAVILSAALVTAAIAHALPPDPVARQSPKRRSRDR